MHDKEVGELWRGSFYGPADVMATNKRTRELIRKLVEERASAHCGLAFWPHIPEEERPRYFDQAIRDFGIDPKVWKEFCGSPTE